MDAGTPPWTASKVASFMQVETQDCLSLTKAVCPIRGKELTTPTLSAAVAILGEPTSRILGKVFRVSLRIPSLPEAFMLRSMAPERDSIAAEIVARLG